MLINVTKTDFRNELCRYVFGNYALYLVYAKMTLQIVIAMSWNKKNPVEQLWDGLHDKEKQCKYPVFYWRKQTVSLFGWLTPPE